MRKKFLQGTNMKAEKYPRTRACFWRSGVLQMSGMACAKDQWQMEEGKSYSFKNNASRLEKTNRGKVHTERRR